jgi:AcrR family transcriptional regulator
VTAIAERAGVQRLTVYRHFPDQEAIFRACTAHAFADFPPPDPESWLAVPDPSTRMRTALLQVYAYYRRRRSLLSNLYRDAEVPVVAAALSRRRQVLTRSVAVLSDGWLGRSAVINRLVAAAIGHALEFATWHSLAENQGLSDENVADMMLGFICSVVGPGTRARQKR